jgi:hypothetical protein
MFMEMMNEEEWMTNKWDGVCDRNNDFYGVE